MKHLIFITTLLTVSILKVTAQSQEDKTKWWHNIPLTIAVFSETNGLFNESVRLPSLNHIVRDGGKGVRLGTEFYYNKNKKKKLVFQTANLSVFRNTDDYSGLYINSSFGYRRIIADKFFLDGQAGVGMLSLKYATNLYEQDESGNIKEISNRRLNITTNLNMGMGYKLKDRYLFFVRYEWMIEPRFSEDFPVEIYRNLQIGTNIYFKFRAKGK